MGVLNKLREKSNKKIIQEHREKTRQIEDIHDYEETYVPKLEYINTYLTELVDHLGRLEPIIVDSYTDKYKGFKHLKQHEYRLMTNVTKPGSNDKILKEIFLIYRFSGKFKVQHEIFSTAELNRQIKFLQSLNIPHKWKHMTGGNNIVARIDIDPEITVLTKFTANLDEEKINVSILNHTNFSKFQRKLSLDEINEQLMDDFANFIMRENENFFHIDLTSEEREKIRKRLEEDNLRRKNEELGFMGRMKNKIFSKDN